MGSRFGVTFIAFCCSVSGLAELSGLRTGGVRTAPEFRL